MGAKKNVTVDGSSDQVKIVAQTPSADAATKPSVSPKALRQRSKHYQAARAKVDRLKFYEPAQALALACQLSYASFDASVNADLVLKDVDNQIKVSFPFSTGKSLRIGIVDEALLADIAKGKIDFDLLLTTPVFMPKLAKLARILGPKGLMPNPKNGTIVADPQKTKAELLSGKTVLKTERKAPLLHVTLGKVSLGAAKLASNLEALLAALEGKVLKVVVSATMSPGIKVSI